MVETIGIITAVVAVGVTLLGLLCGGVWWMSTMAADVKSIRASLEKLGSALWGKVEMHSDKLEDHNSRLIRLEERKC